MKELKSLDANKIDEFLKIALEAPAAGQGKSKMFRSQINDLPFCEVTKQLLNKMTQKQLLLHLKKNPSDFRGIDNQTPELCKKAVQLLLSNLKYVKNQTIDVCLVALSQDHSESLAIHEFVRIVSNPDFKNTMNNLREKKSLIELLKDNCND